MKNMKLIWNGKADCADGKGIAHAITGDHDNRPTDMTNIILLESNQNHAKVITDADKCTPLVASMGMGGGYVPMIAYIDGWGGNMEKLFTDDKMNTIRSSQP